MKLKEILEEAKKEIEEEDREAAKEQIKIRLREIREGEKVLSDMRKNLEKLLEEEV